MKTREATKIILVKIMEDFKNTSEQPLNEEELQQRVGEVYEEILELPEVSEALDLLDDLPEYLKYHNKGHTLSVIHEAVLFAVAASESEEVIKMLATAAAWHDVGYLKQHENNEPIAVDIFKESEAFDSFSEDQQQEIIASILDTQLKINEDGPHIEQDRSQYGYLLDADTSNFGKEEFWTANRQVAEELGVNLEDEAARKEFLLFTLSLLKNHTWKTPVAEALRQKKKEENLAKLRSELSKLKDEE